MKSRIVTGWLAIQITIKYQIENEHHKYLNGSKCILAMSFTWNDVMNKFAYIGLLEIFNFTKILLNSQL
jgi:hypothetical protein